MSSPDAEVSPPGGPKGGRIGLLALVCLIFFTVSGGPYGLESLVGEVGPGWAVVLIALTPLLWALPEALMVAELSSAIPEEGGYYVWVRRALGDFWGVQEGWWTIGYTAVDLAIYPVLFVNYLTFFVPGLALDEDGGSTWGVFGARWLVALALIGVALALNLRGAGAVGKNATWTIGVVLGVFVVLSVLGLSREGAAASAAEAVRRGLGEGGMGGSLAVGLAAVLWNYCGWDNVSTYASEVRDPGRNYPRALLITLPLIAASYLIPVLAGLGTTTDPAVWSESKGWPAIAEMIAGPWFGRAVAVAALVSAWSLFNSQLLYVARLPAAMARDGWLPAPLARVSAADGRADDRPGHLLPDHGGLHGLPVRQAGGHRHPALRRRPLAGVRRLDRLAAPRAGPAPPLPGPRRPGRRRRRPRPPDVPGGRRRLPVTSSARKGPGRNW